MEYRAIIVLGADEKASKSRVNKALEFYSDKAKMILAGNGTDQYMKEMASEGGVADPLVETRSRESIGNLFNAKQEYLGPNGLKRVAVVSSDYHVPRVKRACEKIFGKDYKVDVIGSNDPLTSQERYTLVKNERLKSIFDRLFLAGPANDKIIKKKLSAMDKAMSLKYGRI